MTEVTPDIAAPLANGDLQRIGTAGLTGHSDVFFAAVTMTRMPMLITDPHRPDNPIVFANQAFCALSGYPLGELVGRNCRMLQGPDTDRGTVIRLRDAIARRTDISVEILNYRKDGTPFWNALFVSPVFGRDGELLYFFASQLDVTRRREAERALMQAQRLEGLGSLAGGVAHEFNNLLTVIRGNLEPLLRDATDARMAIRLNRVRDASERAAMLTRSMISFARRQRLEDQSIEVNSLLREVRPALELVVSPECRLEIAESDAPAFIRADPEQLQTALVNVLLNARDAQPRDGMVRVKVRVHRTLAARGSEVEVAITDNGRGMSPAVVQRAIDPFFTTKQPGTGVGLGLSMAYGFTRQTGGRLELSSREGEGTTVRFLFPGVAFMGEYLPRALQGETLLLVDDDGEFRGEAQRMLEGLGYRVLAAPDGNQALEHLATPQRIDLMMCDVAMPDLAGPDLVSRASAMRPRLKVLYATGFPAPQGRPALGKPFAMAELAREVREVLDGGPDVMLG